MPTGDWIRLYRGLLESRAFHSDGLLKVWIWCLLKATYRRRWVPVTIGNGTSEVKLEPGQFLFGRESAARELRMKPSTVHDRMEKLANMQNLVMQPDRHYTLISICNWERYQSAASDEQQPEQLRADSQPTAGQQPSDTNKKDKKGKNHSSSRPKLRFDEGDMVVAAWMLNRIIELQPDRKKPNLDHWANTIRLMREVDRRTHDEIRSLYEAVNRDRFWQTNVLCPEKLREKWDDLKLKLIGSGNGRRDSVRTAGGQNAGARVRERDYSDIKVIGNENPAAGD